MSSLQVQQNITFRRGISYWLDCTVRICLMVFVSLCAYLVFAQTAADRYSRQQTPQAIRKAIWWEQGNPEHYAELARSLERPLKQDDLPVVVALYEKAVQISAHNAYYWARLGQAYEWAGRSKEAQNAYERAKSLLPASPTMNWTIGNFYLREGRTEEALRSLQKTILGDPELRQSAFDLAWRATQDGDLIASEMIPARADIYFEYLDYLLGVERVDEAAKVWERVVEMGFYFEPAKAFPYLDALIQRRRIDEAMAAWYVVLKNNPSQRRGSAPDGNLVNNGDFECEILNGGLDWRINPASGAVIGIDPVTFHEGTHSLRIHFEGNQNLSDVLIFQYVPARPNTLYRFVAYMRAQGITTDSGPRFQIRDAADPVNLFFQSTDLVGNSSWVRRQLDFKSGPATRLLEIRIARPSSTKFDNRIAGSVWVSQVALTAIASLASTNSAGNGAGKQDLSDLLLSRRRH